MPNPQPPHLDAQKSALRRSALLVRSVAAAGAGPGAARALSERLLEKFSDVPAGVVSGYLAIGDELNVVPALEAFRSAGHVIALPVVVGAGRPLTFRRWQPDMNLEDGPLRTRHPPVDAGEVVPNILLVPMLAFDGAGYRIGWGGGFYDRTLADLRAAGPVIAVGIAFADQRVDKVPHDHHDARLDWIATETAILRAG